MDNRFQQSNTLLSKNKNASWRYRNLTGGGTVKNVNSYTFLAGRLNIEGRPDAGKFDKQHWRLETLDEDTEDYKELIKNYYPAHIKAMMGVQEEKVKKGKNKGNENQMSRYKMVIPKHNNNLMRLFLETLDYEFYPCVIEDVSVWLFPYGIVLFSIKINDSGTDLDKLTKMHGRWKEWGNNYTKIIKKGEKTYDIGFHTSELDKLLEPLYKLTKDGLPEKLTYEGTKMRQYQVVQCDSNRINDELLYEIGTFSPIGVIKNTNPCTSFKPADDYYKTIMRENTVSAYSNWKALALNDSFTVLAIDEIYRTSEFEDNYRYFELLYMRCLLAEYYCFDRNNRYHDLGNQNINAEEQLREIRFMENQYFYDDLSYNFLPPLMIRAMSKGLGLENDRKELTEHIYQDLSDEQNKEKERRRTNNSLVVSIVQVFALYSIFWTLYQMFEKIEPCWWAADSVATIAFCVATIISFILLISLFITLFKRKKRK